MDSDNFRSNVGMDIEGLAAQAQAMFYKLINRDGAAWDQTDDEVQDRWFDFCIVMTTYYVNESEVAWGEMTSRAVAQYHHKSDAYKVAPTVMRYIWQAVCRHVINLLNCEDNSDLSELEDTDVFWREWVLEKAQGQEHDDTADGTPEANHQAPNRPGNI